MSRSERVEDGWLVLAYPNNPVIRLDGRVLDDVSADDSTIELSIDEVSFRLSLAWCEVAQGVASELARYTRRAPITTEAECEVAKSRLARLRGGETRDRFLFLGEHSIFASKGVVAGDPSQNVGLIVVDGEGRFIDYVADLAEKGESLSFPAGRIQAAVAMLAVAVLQYPESPELLERRIASYERSGT